MPDVPFAPLPLAIVFSDDESLRGRLGTALHERAYLVSTISPARLRTLLHDGAAGGPGTGDPLVLFFDLRLPESAEVFHEIIGPARIRVCTVAVGRPGSSPYAAAEEARIYRCVDYRTLTDARAVAAVADAALERVSLQQENLLLRAELARARAGGNDPLLAVGNPAATADGFSHAAVPLALRQIVRPTRLGGGGSAAATTFEHVVEGVAGALTASRVGLYLQAHEGAPFRLRAGRQVLDPGLEFGPEDPLGRWLDRYRQPMTRRAADALGDAAARTLLRRALDLLGAECLVPLVVRGRLEGWLFTGLSFGGADTADFHSLHAVAEHAGAAVENSLLHDEAVLQTTLFESLLNSLPTAVIAVEPDGVVRWANARAEALFPVLTIRRRPGRRAPIIEDVSGRLAGLIHAALDGEPPSKPLVWELPLTARTYSARVYAARAGADLGGRVLAAFAVIEDVTTDLAAHTRREAAIQQALCVDLANGLAHEVRSPLFALKTFSQLLPQRHAEEEFRTEFGGIIERDVGRLDELFERLERFAHPPKPGERRSVHVVDLLRAAQDTTQKLLAAADPRIKLLVAGRQLGVAGPAGTAAQANAAQLPTLTADSAALVHAFTALFVNGVEAAVRKRVIPVITVDVVRYGADFLAGQRNGNGNIHGNGHGYGDEDDDSARHRHDNPDCGVRLSISDNGTGIAPELLPRVFSPFCTTKAQGLGLGLPSARNIILEHGGRLELDSGTRGLCAHVVLPLR